MNKLFEVAVRDMTVCTELFSALLGRSAWDAKYTGRPYDDAIRSGVRVRGILNWGADISALEGMQQIDDLSCSECVDAELTYILVALDGITDADGAITQLIKDDIRIIVLDANRYDDARVSDTVQEFLRALSTGSLDAPQTALGRRMAQLIPLCVATAPLLTFRSVALGPHLVHLPAMLSQEPFLEWFLTQVTGREVVLEGQPDTDLNWWHDIHADAEQDDFEVAVLPFPILPGAFRQVLLELAGSMTGRYWGARKDVVVVCGFDALGGGRCYYRIEPAVTTLPGPKPLDAGATIHVFCVPGPGMERNAPEGIQALLDGFAAGTSEGIGLEHLAERTADFGWRSVILTLAKLYAGALVADADADMGQLSVAFDTAMEGIRARILECIATVIHIAIFDRYGQEVREIARDFRISTNIVSEVLNGSCVDCRSLMCSYTVFKQNTNEEGTAGCRAPDQTIL